MRCLLLGWGLVLWAAVLWAAVLMPGTRAASAPGGGGGRNQRRGGGRGGEGAAGDKQRRLHRVQHGRCSYTFVLPEMESCQGSHVQQGGASVLQKDGPPTPGQKDWLKERLQHLETSMENNTHWIQKLDSYLQEKSRLERAHIQSHAVHNQTASMLELGSSLLTHTAEQTRNLNTVEAKVLNRTSRIEMQLLESSLSTRKLEKDLMVQTSELSRLLNRNSRLESQVQVLETQQRGDLENMRQDKGKLQVLVQTQTAAIQALQKQLRVASSNNTAMQRQQQQLMESVHKLIAMVTTETVPFLSGQRHRDCADVYRAGYSTSGLYHVYIGNMTEPTRVFCDMETSGGGWTVFQRRVNGSLDFQRSWEEYKLGFGDPSGEHWLGNELVYQLTTHAQYAMRVVLQDWEGHAPYSHYDKFQLGSEKQHYRLFLRGYSGTAGEQSSLASHGSSFSTRDQDNDNCLCKCALMLTGGWWFDACGLSNLNGIYYTMGRNIRKLNGIKWHHFRGPSYSLRFTAMMLRPATF
ncbi:angiopoietin-4 [Osmerus mordax]|uniref:angiopoietin-4 n=1 Tax=Osmerus mordax TaxID=8014 RepID=UPI00350EE936